MLKYIYFIIIYTTITTMSSKTTKINILYFSYFILKIHIIGLKSELTEFRYIFVYDRKI